MEQRNISERLFRCKSGGSSELQAEATLCGKEGLDQVESQQGQFGVLSKGGRELARDFNRESDRMESQFYMASSATVGEVWGAGAVCQTDQRPCHPQRQGRWELGPGRGGGKETQCEDLGSAGDRGLPGVWVWV